MSSRCIKGRKKEKPRSALLPKRLCTRQFSFECFFAVTAEKCTKKCGARSELFCNCTQKCDAMHEKSCSFTNQTYRYFDVPVAFNQSSLLNP